MTPYFDDGTIRLFHGDCLEVLDWLEADVLITDPPYGRDWKQGDFAWGTKSQKRDGIANDSTTAIRDAALNRWGGGSPNGCLR